MRFLLLVPLKIGRGFVLKGEAKVGLDSGSNSFFLGSVALRKSGYLPCSMVSYSKAMLPLELLLQSKISTLLLNSLSLNLNSKSWQRSM